MPGSLYVGATNSGFPGSLRYSNGGRLAGSRTHLREVRREKKLNTPFGDSGPIDTYINLTGQREYGPWALAALERAYRYPC
jgi:hypothetical protein